MANILNTGKLRRADPMLHILQFDRWLAPSFFVRRLIVWYAAGALGGIAFSPVPGAAASLIYMGFFYIFLFGLRGGVPVDEYRRTGGFRGFLWSKHRNYRAGQEGFSLVPIWTATLAQTFPYFAGLMAMATFSYGGPLSLVHLADPFLGMVGLYSFPPVELASAGIYTPVLMSFIYLSVSFLIALARKASSSGVPEYAIAFGGVFDPINLTLVLLGVPIGLMALALLLINVLAPEQFALMMEEAQRQAGEQAQWSQDGAPSSIGSSAILAYGAYVYVLFVLLWLRDLTATLTALIRNRINKRQRRLVPRMIMGTGYLAAAPLVGLWMTYAPDVRDGPVVLAFLVWVLPVLAAEPLMNRILRRTNTIPFTG